MRVVGGGVRAVPLLRPRTALTEPTDPDSPSCKEVWAPIYELAQAGSIAMSLWSDSQRESWFKR